MMTLWRLITTAAIALLIVSFKCPNAVFADDDLPDESGAAKNADAAQEPSGDLKSILERLKGRNRELVELRIKTGKNPEDARDRKIIALLEMPYLGSAFYGSPTNQRFFAVKLTLVNLTDQPLLLKRDEVRLVADGQNYQAREATE